MATVILDRNYLLELYGGLSNLQNQTKIEITEERIEKIDENAFVGFDNLKVLDLNSNKLKTIKSNQFERLINLETLELQQNQIAELDENAFVG
jgi:Leucine-rich repeat (LRR) protein